MSRGFVFAGVVEHPSNTCSSALESVDLRLTFRYNEASALLLFGVQTAYVMSVVDTSEMFRIGGKRERNCRDGAKRPCDFDELVYKKEMYLQCECVYKCGSAVIY